LRKEVQMLSEDTEKIMQEEGNKLDHPDAASLPT
jgi:hypothetical protein